jgi:hypothetical protein
MIIFFHETNSFSIFEIIEFSMINYDIVTHMSSEIIQSEAYDNYDDFQHVNFIFSQKFISLFLRIIFI